MLQNYTCRITNRAQWVLQSPVLFCYYADRMPRQILLIIMCLLWFSSWYQSGHAWLTYSLWAIGVIWWHRYGSTLAQVMAHCLMAPSHDDDLSSVRSSDIHLKAISQRIPQPSITKFSLKMTSLKFIKNSQGQPMRLTHNLSWVTHICVSKLTIIASDNGLSTGRRQAIIRTNVGWNVANLILREKLQ